jgi:hypothetical protein
LVIPPRPSSPLAFWFARAGRVSTRQCGSTSPNVGRGLTGRHRRLPRSSPRVRADARACHARALACAPTPARAAPKPARAAPKPARATLEPSRARRSPRVPRSSPRVPRRSPRVPRRVLALRIRLLAGIPNPTLSMVGCRRLRDEESACRAAEDFGRSWHRRSEQSVLSSLDRSAPQAPQRDAS